MSRFLRRSFLQVVAAVVVLTGVSASDLFAGTTHDVYGYTFGTTPDVMVGLLYKFQFSYSPSGIPMVGWYPQPLEGPIGEFVMPVVASVPLVGMPGSQYTYKRTLLNLTPGSDYKAPIYIRSGVGPGYTYTSVAGFGVQWTQQ